MASPAYVVLAHKSPNQLRALIRSLGQAPVYLHIDQRVRGPLEDELLGPWPGNVRLLPRRATRWASWGVMQAALDGMAAAEQHGASHVITLSGQDLPLVSQREIEAFLDGSGVTSFVPGLQVPTPWFGDDGARNRFRGWHFSVGRRDLRLPIPNPMPAGLVPHVGSFWCAMHSTAVRRVLDAISRPAFRRFFKRIWIPDEGLIPSILYSYSPDLVVHENLWFQDWAGGGAAHPITFGTADVDRLAAVAGRPDRTNGYGRAKLFARKFDVDETGPRVLASLGDRLGLSYGAD